LDNEGSLLKIIALLLQYPDSDLLADLDELDQAIEALSDEATRQECRKLAAYLRSTSKQRLQEDYTATFDLASGTCLNLSYHKFGDGKERGSALLAFREAYKSMGYEPTAAELPDYLPMVLELLSVCPESERSGTMMEYGEEIENIRRRLEAEGSPYTGLFRVLSSLPRES
jgi:nitrate reductase molybdenum cofactor assembly chaperone NarJ/NarW